MKAVYFFGIVRGFATFQWLNRGKVAHFNHEVGLSHSCLRYWLYAQAITERLLLKHWHVVFMVVQLNYKKTIPCFFNLSPPIV